MHLLSKLGLTFSWIQLSFSSSHPASITAINYWMMLIGGNGGDYGGDSGGGDDSGGGVGCEGFLIMIY